MSKTKAILLAGGSGTRMYPNSLITSKQLLPVYDKPMIYYSLSTLLLAEIKDIILISTPNDLNNFKKLFGNGSKLGINIEFPSRNIKSIYTASFNLLYFSHNPDHSSHIFILLIL